MRRGVALDSPEIDSDLPKGAGMKSILHLSRRRLEFLQGELSQEMLAAHLKNGLDGQVEDVAQRSAWPPHRQAADI